MSKELELLKQIKRFDGNMSREQNQRYAELEEALTPPTADEVCKVLSEYLDKNVEYFNIFGFVCDERVIICLFPNNVLSFNTNYPAHIYNIVSRFYEGLEK